MSSASKRSSKLVASMIVKNELDRYLTLAVEHLLTFCDEIRVLDDFSDDGTYEWLLARDGVYVLTNPGESFLTFESDARNELLKWTMVGDPDYVLSIDADEFVGNPQLIRKIVDSPLPAPVYTLDMEEVWRVDQNLHIRTDGAWKSRLCPILWKAPETLTREWMIPPRKLACGREPQKVRRTKFQRSGSPVYHFGWANVPERQARAERYFEHDQGKFHRDQHLQSILWPDDKVMTRSFVWPEGLIDLRGRIVERAHRGQALA